MVFKAVISVLVLCHMCYCDNYDDLSDTDYASLPILFHMDNFDDCMLLKRRALYCYLSYELQPLHSNGNQSKTWINLKKLRGNPYNYRHDILRHNICVPKTCPNATKVKDNKDLLSNSLTNCYNEKVKHLGLTGTITKIDCETDEPKYPMDYWDSITAKIFKIYVIFVIITSLSEKLLRDRMSGFSNEVVKPIYIRLIEAFSIPRNWNRLKTINTNPDIERLKCIQGVRFYNMILVILTHTIYISFISLPISNTKRIEKLADTDRLSAAFLTSGPLCISTFFMLSSFLLTHGILERFQNQNAISFYALLSIFVKRYIRLTPSLAVIVAFQSTWLRHLGTGPNWNRVVGIEYLQCRENGWTNIFYINNYFKPENMCLQTTWYLALDTQYFAIILLLIWFIRKYQKCIWTVLGCFLAINVLIAFYRNYVNNFPAVMIPQPESLYQMKHTLRNQQWHIQYIGFFENMSGPVIGIGMGYLYFKHKEQKLFKRRLDTWMWWIISHGLGYGTVIIPGLLSLSKDNPTNIFWASVHAAISRPLFAFGIGFALFGMTHGVGGVTKRILEWPPIYVLGRLSYAAYLVHIPLLLLRAGMIRSTVYFNEYSIFFELLGMLAVTYLVAAIFTLLFEMPISGLQKVTIFQDNKAMTKKNVNR